ncbi:DAK2 domain-containing protein, partial [Streptomyces scopuliridis]
EAVALGAGAGTVLAHAGAAWSERAGGTSGALWGAALTSFGAVLGDHDGGTGGGGSGPAGRNGSTGGRDATDGARLTRAVRAAVDAVLRIGGARPGDKTLVDAAVPFADRLEAALPSAGFAAAWAQAARAASEAAEA